MVPGGTCCSGAWAGGSCDAGTVPAALSEATPPGTPRPTCAAGIRPRLSRMGMPFTSPRAAMIVFTRSKSLKNSARGGRSAPESRSSVTRSSRGQGMRFLLCGDAAHDHIHHGIGRLAGAIVNPDQRGIVLIEQRPAPAGAHGLQGDIEIGHETQIVRHLAPIRRRAFPIGGIAIQQLARGAGGRAPTSRDDRG